ncbi:hypothetical protein GFL92_01105 [Rhizobium leguminosarum bv. viciae]|nr:hypothetical protein [Rhizobium leguminosarum bv. viciae]
MRGLVVVSSVREIYRDFLDDVFEGVRTIALTAPDTLRPVLDYHLSGLERSKGFRPAFVLAASTQVHSPMQYSDVVHRAAIVQLYHEMTLLADDIFDHSRYRRGQVSAHCRFGTLITVCAAAWAKEVAVYLLRHDHQAVEALCTCAFELVDAEALQWSVRLHSRPVALSTWMRIARGDTGGLFRLAASLAGYDPNSSVVEAIYILYHGLDDVSDLLELDELGGPANADVRDGIPTLLTCFTAGRQKGELAQAIPAALTYLSEVLERGSTEGGEMFLPFFDELSNILTKAQRTLERQTAQQSIVLDAVL